MCQATSTLRVSAAASVLFLQNFLQVEFVADTLKLNLLELGKTGSRLISVVGKLDYQCPAGETHDPITFTTRESHLVSYCRTYVQLR